MSPDFVYIWYIFGTWWVRGCYMVGAWLVRGWYVAGTWLVRECDPNCRNEGPMRNILTLWLERAPKEEMLDASCQRNDFNRYFHFSIEPIKNACFSGHGLAQDSGDVRTS